MGNDVFIVAYFLNLALAGGNPCTNVFEAKAGFADGNYDACG